MEGHFSIRQRTQSGMSKNGGVTEQLSEIWNLISDPYPVVQLPLFLHWFILMLALGIDP